MYKDLAAFCEEIDVIIDSFIGEKVQLFDEYMKIDENMFSSLDRTKKDKEEEEKQEQKSTGSLGSPWMPLNAKTFKTP